MISVIIVVLVRVKLYSNGERLQRDGYPTFNDCRTAMAAMASYDKEKQFNRKVEMNAELR